ncbi:MAG: hypothetical protein GY754_31955 [bacterium]|nr:hypothetical protein [bacterium]
MNLDTSQGLRISVEKSVKRTRLLLEGALCISDVNRVMSILSSEFREKPEIVEMDCNNLLHIDSSVVGAMVWFDNTAAEYGTKLVFSRLNQGIDNIFRTARLKHFFNTV